MSVFVTEIIDKGERNKNESKSDAFNASFCYRNDVGLELRDMANARPLDKQSRGMREDAHPWVETKMESKVS